MKFVRLAFRCFGPFENQEIDLSGSGGFHLIFGPNEAGKSSALRGLHAFLFGFPSQTSDDFRFNYKQFRIGATLEDSSGKTLDFVRRKGNKATLLSGDERTEIAESTLGQFVGGLQQQQFEQIYGLDSKRLVEGGRIIAEGRGDLGEAIFAAGAGLAGLRALAQALETRQNELYKPKGQNQPIAKALKEFQTQTTEYKKSLLTPETYEAAANRAHRTEEQAALLRDERNKVRSKLALLQRYQNALPTIELFHRAQTQLAPVADAPVLTEDFETTFNQAWQQREIAGSRLSSLTAERTELETLLREEPLQEAVLAEEREIDELKKLVGADAKLQTEAIKAKTRCSEETGEARDIFRELTGTTEWDQMDSLKPRLEDERRINELANEHAAVKQNVSQCESAFRHIEQALNVAKAKQAESTPPPDSSPWAAAVEAIAAMGSLEQQAQTHRRDVATKEVRLRGEFEQFQPSVPSLWSEAANTPVPSIETINHFASEQNQRQQAVRRTEEERDQLDRDMATLQEQLLVTAGAEPVPTVEDLAKSRHDRDGGIHLIRRRLMNQADDESETSFIARHASGRPLVDAAEAAIRQCDDLADRLRHEADRVAAWQTLRQKLELLQERRTRAVEKIAAANDALGQLEQSWHAAWQPANITPATPEVMMAWLLRWQQFSQQAVEWNGSQLKCQEEERQIADLRSQLAEVCPATMAAKSLAEGLAIARQASIDAKNAQAASQKLSDEILRLQGELIAAEAQWARAKTRHETWTEQWSAAIALLKLRDPGVSVETVQDYLKRISAMQQHLTDMRIKAARVREIEKERELLLDRLTSLRKRLDPLSSPSTADTLDTDFREIDRVLAAARTGRAQHEARVKQLDKVCVDIDAATAHLREAEATLHALAVQAGVAEIDGIAAAAQRAKARQLAEQRLQEQETALALSSGGRQLDEFIDAAVAKRDLLDPEMETLQSRAQQLDSDITATEGEALRASQDLDVYQQASDAAAAAKQQAEMVLGRLEDQVMEYAALHLARVALDRAKTRYRARNQDSLLHLAGDFFETLTDQAFSGLDIDNEEGIDVLVAVRAGDQTAPHVRVDGLSEGTRDQLFLALRLAGIKQHLLEREPVPLILDDVLISFDDDRAKATLRCLIELASETQVLLFTHHRHVIDLAKGVCPAIHVHELHRRQLSSSVNLS